MEVLRQVAEQPPQRPTTLNVALPLDVETICLKCLEKDPVRRYPSALAMAEDLERFLRHEPITARRVYWNEKLWRWCRRKPALAAALGTCGLVFIFGLAGVLWPWRRATAGEAFMRHDLDAADINLAQQVLAEQHMSLASTLEGQLFALSCAALSADGQRLTVGGADGSVKLWDTQLRRSVGTLPHQAHIGWIGILGFHPDGNTLVSASDRALVI